MLRQAAAPELVHALDKSRPDGSARRPMGIFRRFVANAPESVTASLIMLAACAVILAMTLPAFRAFFLAEDFIYLGLLRDHGGEFWMTVGSAIDGIFFRPVFIAANLAWQSVLPLDPLAHHARNLVFSGIDVGLMWILLGTVDLQPRQRAIPTLFFAVSKVHLTTIGYINVYDSILSLMLLLLTAIFAFRFAKGARRLDYVLALAFATLSIFTKDYGIAVVAVVGAIWLFAWRPAAERWWPHARRVVLAAAPLAAVVVVYFWLRLQVATPVISDAVYSPQLSIGESARKVFAFISTLANLGTPLIDAATLGSPGLAGFVGTRLLGERGAYLDLAAFGAFVLLAGATLVLRREQRGSIAIGLLWIAAYLGPTVLTRNLQMYYFLEPLAGAALLLGVCLRGASPRLIGIWASGLVVVAANGAVSNYASSYNWQFAADLTAEVKVPLLEAHLGEPLDSVTFVTENSFWAWGFAADGAPMLQTLMRRPSMKVAFTGYDQLQALHPQIDATHLLFDIDNGFVERVNGSPVAAFAVSSMSPSRTKPGERFNIQPNGQSAISLTVVGARRGVVVVMGGRRLATTYGSSTLVTALVPDDLIAREARVPIYITDGFASSPPLTFEVSSETSTVLPLVLHAVSPDSTTVGVEFGRQPNGNSAISISCENGAPGAIVVFQGRELVTAFGDSTWLTAEVPPDLLARAGSYEVYLKEGGRESNHVAFVVRP
jgi:hypothetical protein